MKIKHLFVPLAVLHLLSCGAESEDNTDNSVNIESSEQEVLSGSCINLYEDALITVSSVREESTGFELNQLHISNITLNGNLVDLPSLSQDNFSNFSMDTDGGGGFCTVPCSFLEGEGDVSFLVSANGYKSKTIELVAEYENFQGGCPSRSSGGVEIEIEIESES